jgi:hypothetical protein
MKEEPDARLDPAAVEEGGLMAGAAVMEAFLGVNAEKRSLEEAGPPLSAA